MPTLIDNPADPRLAAYGAIRERDLVGRQNRFVVEGEVVLRLVLAAAADSLESVLVTESRLARLEHALQRLPPEIAVFVVPQGVMNTLAGFVIHRGVLAIGRRRPEPNPGNLLAAAGERALAVGLIGLANHDNVGGVYRNAAAFGVAAVLRDPATCDPLYRKAIRVSVGATLLTASAQAGGAVELVRALRDAGFETLALTPAGREDLRAVRRTPRMALLLGSEGSGLPDQVLDETRTIRIPMVPGLDSLNVATASGIALHHLADDL